MEKEKRIEDLQKCNLSLKEATAQANTEAKQPAVMKRCPRCRDSQHNPQDTMCHTCGTWFDK